MGNNNKKPEKDPREEIEESIINMKITSKQFENAAKRAQRDQKKEIDKAKAVILFVLSVNLQALKKNNEEGAKYLIL